MFRKVLYFLVGFNYLAALWDSAKRQLLSGEGKLIQSGKYNTNWPFDRAFNQSCYFAPPAMCPGLLCRLDEEKVIKDYVGRH